MAIYLLSGIGGNVCSYMCSYAMTGGGLEEQIASLGASGAIFGLAGALLVFFSRNQVRVRAALGSAALRLCGSMAAGPEDLTRAFLGTPTNQVLYRDKNVPNGMFWRLLSTVVLNFAISEVLPDIDVAGHWGGLLSGVMLALIVGPHYELVRTSARTDVLSHTDVYLVDTSVMTDGRARLVYHK